jgi:hypothetical protein
MRALLKKAEIAAACHLQPRLQGNVQGQGQSRHILLRVAGNKANSRNK